MFVFVLVFVFVFVFVLVLVLVLVFVLTFVLMFVLTFVFVLPATRSQIANSGLGLMSAEAVDTVGAEKSGTVDPPVSTLAVPVGEMKTRLEFDESAVAHGS